VAYYDALDDACRTGDHGPITDLVTDAMLRSLDIYNCLVNQKQESA